MLLQVTSQILGLIDTILRQFINTKCWRQLACPPISYRARKKIHKSGHVPRDRLQPSCSPCM